MRGRPDESGNIREGEGLALARAGQEEGHGEKAGEERRHGGIK